MNLGRELNTGNFERESFNRSNSPRMSRLEQLLRKLQEELAAVNEAAQAEFSGNYDLHQQTKNFEIDMIRHALFLTNNNQQRAAQMLGIKYTTLNAKVKRYGIR